MACFPFLGSSLSFVCLFFLFIYGFNARLLLNMKFFVSVIVDSKGAYFAGCFVTFDIKRNRLLL